MESYRRECGRFSAEEHLCGTQYIWNNVFHIQNASLLWRTREPLSPADGWPGSVMYLGRPSEPTAQAVCFQNFEIPCTIPNRSASPGGKIFELSKGGFVRPSEIRKSEILEGYVRYSHLGG